MKKPLLFLSLAFAAMSVPSMSAAEYMEPGTVDNYDIVNNEYINGFSSDSIIIDNNTFIPISKKYKNVKEDYFKWLGEKYE